jgi:hypothetical protein
MPPCPASARVPSAARIRSVYLAAFFGFLLVVTRLSAGEIDISSLYGARVGHGDTVQVNFGIGNYASLAGAGGFSPYPTALDLLVVAALPTSDLSDFSVSADLVSEDGATSIQLTPFPLFLEAGSFKANGGPNVAAGIFFASVAFSSEVSHELFTSAAFVKTNTSAAAIIVTNLGDPFTIGVGGYYAETLPIGGCCVVQVPGITGDSPFSTGGNAGTVLLATTPEPSAFVCVSGAVLFVFLRRRLRRLARLT